MPGLVRSQTSTNGGPSTFSHTTPSLPSRYRVGGTELQVDLGQPNVGSRIQVLWEWYVLYNNGERVEVLRHRWFNAVVIGPAFAINGGSGQEELMKDSFGNQVWGLQYDRDEAFGDQQRNRLVVFPCQGVIEDYHDGESYDWRFVREPHPNAPRRQNATTFSHLTSNPLSSFRHNQHDHLRMLYDDDDIGCESCDEEDEIIIEQEEEDDDHIIEEEEEEDTGEPMDTSDDEEEDLENVQFIGDWEGRESSEREGQGEEEDQDEIGMLARRVGFVVDSNLLNSALYDLTTNEGLCQDAINLMREQQDQVGINARDLAPVMRQFRAFAYQKLQEVLYNQNITVLDRQTLRQIFQDFRFRGQQ